MSRVAFAFVLLLAGLVHNNAHKWVSPDLKPWVWNITGALYPIVLLVFIAMIVAHPAVWLVVTLLCGFSLQVAGCSVAYLIAPWPLNPNDELCSSGLHAPIGLLGLWATTMVLQRVYLRGEHGRSN